MRKNYLSRIGIIGVGHNPKSIGWQLSMELANKDWLKSLVVANSSPPIDLEFILAQEFRQLSAAGFLPTTNYDSESFHSTDLIVVLADQSSHKQSESRSDLLQYNVASMMSIGNFIKDYSGMVVVVSNPVDVCSEIVLAKSALAPTKLAGFNPDSFRLQSLTYDLSELSGFFSPPISVSDCFVVGTHDDYMVPLTSQIRVNGERFLPWLGDDSVLVARVRDYGNIVLASTGFFAASIPSLLSRFIEELLGYSRDNSYCASIFKDGVCHGFPIELRGYFGDRHIIPAQYPVCMSATEEKAYVNSVQHAKAIMQDVRTKYSVEEVTICGCRCILSREESRQHLLDISSNSNRSNTAESIEEIRAIISDPLRNHSGLVLPEQARMIVDSYLRLSALQKAKVQKDYACLRSHEAAKMHRQLEDMIEKPKKEILEDLLSLCRIWGPPEFTKY